MSHRKTIQHFHEPGHLHELTFSCYQRMPLLARSAQCTHLATCLTNACRERQIDLVAFVFMPEHVHLLVYPRSVNPNISLFLARIKQPFSKRFKEHLQQRDSKLLEELTVQERPGKTCFRAWQEGPGFDRNVFSKKVIAASIDYIHTNPVRRGICLRAADWKWSSARYYLSDKPSRPIDEGLPEIHGLPVGALD